MRLFLSLFFLALNLPVQCFAEEAASTISFEKLFEDEIELISVSNFSLPIVVRSSSKPHILIRSSGIQIEDQLDITLESTTLKITSNSKTPSNSLTVTSEKSGTVVINTPGAGGTTKIIVNGKEIEASANPEVLRLEVFVPKDVSLAIKDVSELTSLAEIPSLRFDSKRTAKANIEGARNLALDLAGASRAMVRNSGNIDATLSGASRIELVSDSTLVDLTAKLSGSSRIRGKGEFRSIDVQTQGASRVETSGSVAGDFVASASGASRIIHSGKISGKIEKTAKIPARIEILEPKNEAP